MGEFKDSMRDGHGQFTWANGDHYEGRWSADKRDGKGVFVTAAGDRYDGQWVAGRKQGMGTYTWTSGDKYEGFWHMDVKEGKGRFSWGDGESVPPTHSMMILVMKERCVKVPYTFNDESKMHVKATFLTAPASLSSPSDSRLKKVRCRHTVQTDAPSLGLKV